MSSRIKREIKAELRSPPSMSADESTSPSKIVNRQQQKKSATMVQIKAERISTPPMTTLPPLSPSKLIAEKAANSEKEPILRTPDVEMDEGEEEATGTDGHEQAGEESTSMGMDAMTVKQRRRMRQAARRARRKSVSKSAEPTPPIGSIQIQPATPKQAKISYLMAKQYLKDPLVVEMVEHRHITLGWQHAGNMASIIRRLMAVTIGQYRSQVEGVPIAIGDVRVIKPLYIIGDHNCMNVDVDVQMIVLKVQPGEPVPGEGVKEIVCHAGSILENKCALGTAYGNLTMTCTPAPTNLDESKMFKARFMGVQFRNANCQIKCAPLGHRRFNQ